LELGVPTTPPFFHKIHAKETKQAIQRKPEIDVLLNNIYAQLKYLNVPDFTKVINDLTEDDREQVENWLKKSRNKKRQKEKAEKVC
jgi:hypothetical protein